MGNKILELQIAVNGGDYYHVGQQFRGKFITEIYASVMEGKIAYTVFAKDKEMLVQVVDCPVVLTYTEKE